MGPAITHQQIDDRIRAMVGLCVEKIDADPSLLNKVWDSVGRIANPRIRDEWHRLQRLPWGSVRQMLLADTEAGARLRQNVPFGGLLTNAERFQFFRRTVQ